MALTEDAGNMVMPVGPMNGNNGGFGFGNDSGWWIILLFILLGNNGWGNWGGNCNGAGNEIQRGFDQAALTSSIAALQSSVVSGFGDLQNTLNQSQMSNMQTMFNLQQQFSNCCCENRLGIETLRNTISTEACADRQSVNDALVNVIQTMNNGFQSMRDEFCQDRLDRKDEKIAELTAINNELSRQASQNAQTAAIIANNEAQTVALERYLAPQAQPAYIVSNPNCCQQNTCGCGCGSF